MAQFSRSISSRGMTIGPGPAADLIGVCHYDRWPGSPLDMMGGPVLRLGMMGGPVLRLGMMGGPVLPFSAPLSGRRPIGAGAPFFVLPRMMGGPVLPYDGWPRSSRSSYDGWPRSSRMMGGPVLPAPFFLPPRSSRSSHKRAAQYVAREFEKAGLGPAGTQGYLQPVGLKTRTIDEDGTVAPFFGRSGECPMVDRGIQRGDPCNS